MMNIPHERPLLTPRRLKYTDVFLSHAHVYVFTEKFDIQPLKGLEGICKCIM